MLSAIIKLIYAVYSITQKTGRVEGSRQSKKKEGDLSKKLGLYEVLIGLILKMWQKTQKVKEER